MWTKETDLDWGLEGRHQRSPPHVVEGDLKDGWDSPGPGEEAVGQYSRWRDQVQSMRCEETWAFQELIEDWSGVGDESGAR